MIKEFVDRFMENKQSLREEFLTSQHPSYGDIVKMVVETVTNDGYDSIDPSRIHQIDDGDYQGTLLFVIAAKGYQPSRYWAVKVGYGSCSGCDTIQAIREMEPYGSSVSEKQADDYMTLALHIVQGLREI